MEAPDEPGKSRESEETSSPNDLADALMPPSFTDPPALAVSFQDAEHRIAELLTAIEHEFRTPLAVIQGYSSMLLLHEQRLAPEERREIHRAIEQASARMARLLDQVLALAQLEAGAVRVASGTVDVPPLVREAITKASRQVPDPLREQVTFHLHLRDEEKNEIQEVPLIQGDSRSICTIVMHLLENAIRFSPEGGRIDVIVQPVASARLLSESTSLQNFSSFLEMCVCDYGIGIPEEHLARIFARFYRVETEISRETPSLGLGLAVCRHLVAFHQGRIWAESCPAGGSAFHVWLPTVPPPLSQVR